MLAHEFFRQFLSNTILPPAERSALSKKYGEMKTKLLDDRRLKEAKAILTVFQQGSYARYTAIGPCRDERADLDIVVVTRLSKLDNEPKDVFDKFRPFLDEHYAGQYEQQGRSFGIKFPEANVDLVLTSDPPRSQVGILAKAYAMNALDPTVNLEIVQKMLAKEGYALSYNGSLVKMDAPEVSLSTEPLEIPDIKAEKWEPTNPMAQYHWTVAKNQRCGGHYIETVRAIKWWRRYRHDVPKYPKGYPLEHLIGQNCPDGLTSAAEGMAATLERITTRYQRNVDEGTVPQLWDHGVRHDVFKRIMPDEFRQFHAQVADAARIAREAIDAPNMEQTVEKWQLLFGDNFPNLPSTRASPTAAVKAPVFNQPGAAATLPPTRFA